MPSFGIFFSFEELGQAQIHPKSAFFLLHLCSFIESNNSPRQNWAKALNRNLVAAYALVSHNNLLIRAASFRLR